MKFTANFLEGAAKCVTVKELIAYAEKNDVHLESDEAKNLLKDLTRDYSSLSDQEMAKVAGGGVTYTTAYHG